MKIYNWKWRQWKKWRWRESEKEKMETLDRGFALSSQFKVKVGKNDV